MDIDVVNYILQQPVGSKEINASDRSTIYTNSPFRELDARHKYKLAGKVGYSFPFYSIHLSCNSNLTQQNDWLESS